MEEKAAYRVIPRTLKSEVRIHKSEYKGRDFVNVRLYRNMVNKENGEREWFPTKKGIAIPVEQLNEYITTLQAFAVELDPADNAQDDPEAEARAQAEAEARPVDRLCQGCRKDCKQFAGALVECPRYEAARPGSRKGKRDAQKR